LGGAQVLGRSGCGVLRPGNRADVAIWDMAGIEAAGSWDPVALLLAGPMRVRDLFVEGAQVVRDGQITTLDLATVVERQNQLARRLMQ
ncbi:MAG: 8-oxoguanine deaminase, partial [Pseudorhodobacter sp.]|nr:8-oxoguanine deaminase [Pseudorhodobacter sp.]